MGAIAYSLAKFPLLEGLVVLLPSIGTLSQICEERRWDLDLVLQTLKQNGFPVPNEKGEYEQLTAVFAGALCQLFTEQRVRRERGPSMWQSGYMRPSSAWWDKPWVTLMTEEELVKRFPEVG